MMKKKAVLAVATAAATLALAGCAGSPKVTVVTVTAPPPKASPAASASATPTAQPALTMEQAKTVYLDVLCPSYDAELEVYRAAQGNSYADMSTAISVVQPLDMKAATVLDGTPWPASIAGLMKDDAVGMRSQVDYGKQVLAAGSMDAANAVPGPTAKNDGPAIRKKLGLPSDPTFECATHDPKHIAFPSGYPKLEKTSSLPSTVRDDFSGGSNPTQVIQLAPGVWTGIDPGATYSDALYTNNLVGYCGSIESYERQYEFGARAAGLCGS